MWDHQCMAKSSDGERCSEESVYAFWCFLFEGEHFDSATWVEVCEPHEDRPQSIVSGWLQIRPRKPVKRETWSDDQVSEFAERYALAALSSEEDQLRGDGLSGDVSTWLDRLHPGARERLDSEARRFTSEHTSDLAAWLTPSRAGYLLWMTGSGEGVGFFSQSLPTDPADELTAYAVSVRQDRAQVAEFDAAMQRLNDAAREFSTPMVYVGQDQTIRLMG